MNPQHQAWHDARRKVVRHEALYRQQKLFVLVYAALGAAQERGHRV
jgi:hypothetical protein